MKILVFLFLFPCLCYAQSNYTPEQIAEYLIQENYVQAFWTARAVYGLESNELVPILDELIAQDPGNIDYLFTKYEITKDADTLLLIGEHYLTLSEVENTEYYIIKAMALFRGRNDIVGYIGMAECYASAISFHEKQTLDYYRQAVVGNNVDTFNVLMQSEDTKQRSMFLAFSHFKKYMDLSREVMEPQYVELYQTLFAQVDTQVKNLQN